MPVINLASSLGSAGEAMAGVTAQQNRNTEQLLSLMQMQEQRRQREAAMSLQERQFAAELERASQDVDYRERAFAEQTQSRLRDDERQSRLVDARVATDEAQLRSLKARETLSERGMAADIQAALPGNYPITGQGVLDMLFDLHSMDSSAATEADNLLMQATEGDYADVAPHELAGLLSNDRRLPVLFTQLGGVVLGVKKRQRSADRAAEVSDDVSSLAKRVEAIGDRQLMEDFVLSMKHLLPQDGATDDSFLDYADGNEYRDDMKIWADRIGVEEVRADTRALLDARRAKLDAATIRNDVMGDGKTSIRELIGRAAGDIEKAKTQQEIRDAYASILPIIDSDASLVYDFAARQVGAAPGMVGGRGGSLTGANASRELPDQMSGRATVTRGEAQDVLDAMSALGMTALPEVGSPEEFALRAEAERRHAERMKPQGDHLKARRMERE